MNAIAKVNNNNFFIFVFIFFSFSDETILSKPSYTLDLLRPGYVAGHHSSKYFRSIIAKQKD